MRTVKVKIKTAEGTMTRYDEARAHPILERIRQRMTELCADPATRDGQRLNELPNLKLVGAGGSERNHESYGRLTGTVDDIAAFLRNEQASNPFYERMGENLSSREVPIEHEDGTVTVATVRSHYRGD